jgi:anti-sigma factor RsiW
MEADGVTLSDDEVRERFSAYHDGELSSEESARVRKRLDESPELAKEYERFSKMLGGLASIGAPAEDAKPGVAPAEPNLDLLAGVQARLNKRSGGKFYQSRYSRGAGVRPLEVIAAAVLIILLLAYVGMTYISGLKPAEPTTPRPAPTRR